MRFAQPSLRGEKLLLPALVFVVLTIAAVGSLGAPLIPTVAKVTHVSLASAQWTLTITFLMGALATPVLGRLGDGPHRRQVIISTLSLMLLGSILTALPLPFAFLIAGRGLQGLGLALTPLAIASARDHLPAERAGAAAATLSITTVAGVGLGYPLSGILTQEFSLRVAYGAGAVVVGAALLAAVLILPSTGHRPYRSLDTTGALVLGVCLAVLLYAISQAASWGIGSSRFLGVATAALVGLSIWVPFELRQAHPIVDLRQLRHRAVLNASLTALLGGTSMYLLLSTASRYVQTPATTGYGFGSSVIIAGCILVPFSFFGFVANRASPWIAARTSMRALLPIGCAIVMVSMTAFAVNRSHIWEIYVILGIAGFGVGCTFAAMPNEIVEVVPTGEISSALSFNRVLQSLGYSTGSALGGVILEANTRRGAVLPSEHGYVAASWIGVAILAGTIALTQILKDAR